MPRNAPWRQTIWLPLTNPTPCSTLNRGRANVLSLTLILTLILTITLQAIEHPLISHSVQVQPH